MTKKKKYNIENELLDGEEVLWTGSPEIPFANFVRSNVRPFSLLGWGTLFIGIIALGVDSTIRWLMLSSIAVLLFIAVPFIIISAWVSYKQRDTVLYAVTSKRILIQNKKAVQSAWLDAIPSMWKQVEPFDTTSIVFDIPSFPNFYRIKDGHEVYRLILQLQDKKEEES